jgi:hypothetical protein
MCSAWREGTGLKISHHVWKCAVEVDEHGRTARDSDATQETE